MMDQLKWLCAGMLLIAAAACSQPDATQEVIAEAPPEITQWMPSPAILVFSETASWRHNEGIAGADLYFVDLAETKGYGIFTTVNSAVFNAEQLARFDLVVFNNVTGDALSAGQKAAFEAWLSDGGAWIGLHGAGDNSHGGWPWYMQSLIGPTFIGHTSDPHIQDARVVILDANHPVMSGLPESFTISDEWYSFDSPASAHGMRVLAGLDESSYIAENQRFGDVTDMRMGPEPADHPVIWATCVGEGKAFYSALGHRQHTYRDATYRQLLENAFDWVVSDTPVSAPIC